MNNVRIVIVRKFHSVEDAVHNRVTKVHLYGGTAGMMFLIDFSQGHFLYGIGVMALAVLDLKDDVNKPH